MRQGKYGSGRIVSGVAAHPIFSGAICFKRFCDDQVGAHLRSGAGASVVLLLRAALRPESGAMIPGGGLGAWRGRADSVLTGRTITTRLRFSPCTGRGRLASFCLGGLSFRVGVGAAGAWDGLWMAMWCDRGRLCWTGRVTAVWLTYIQPSDGRPYASLAADRRLISVGIQGSIVVKSCAHR